MNENALDKLSEQWQAISDEKDRNNYYDQEVFPAICEVVIPREIKRYPEPYPFLILPVGLSPEPLILTISILRPSQVFFLYTIDSQKYLDRIFITSRLSLSQVKSSRIEETNVPDIYRRIKDIFVEWGNPERLVIDITGGKKSMIGGCALAGTMIGARLVYVDFQMPPRKPGVIYNHPIPGSERLTFLENPYDVFGDLEFSRAQSLFSKLDFVSAANILIDLTSKTSTPEYYEARSTLCQAYAAWDDWEIPKASDMISRTINMVENHRRLNPTTPLVRQLPRLKGQLDLLKRMTIALALDKEKGQELELLKNPDLYQPMIGTLHSGAMRQEQRGKLDVAALLWYRLIEFLSQRRLACYGLLTSKADYQNTGTDKAQLKEQFLNICREEFKDSKEPLPDGLPKVISLLEGYTLLKALDDPFVRGLHLGKIRGKINARNKGIFAHGFKPLSDKDYEDFKALAEILVEAFNQVETENQLDHFACQFIEEL